ncbi:MAG: hypothetical protein COB51_03585 [Moraxellaceae bacterium]|nr:MAG: hypothetical protein COB51_03585 [Moraxellaceae bacterium]
MSKTLIFGLICGALLIQGCTTSGIEATGSPNVAPEYAKHLVLHNESLANKVIIQQMNTRRSTGVLEVSAVLANLTSTNKKIQYRFSWYDADNFEVEKGARSWTPVTLSGKSTINMQAVAPNPTVTSYKINVKELK